MGRNLPEHSIQSDRVDIQWIFFVTRTNKDFI